MHRESAPGGIENLKINIEFVGVNTRPIENSN